MHADEYPPSERQSLSTPRRVEVETTDINSLLSYPSDESQPRLFIPCKENSDFLQGHHPDTIAFEKTEATLSTHTQFLHPEGVSAWCNNEVQAVPQYCKYVLPSVQVRIAEVAEGGGTNKTGVLEALLLPKRAENHSHHTSAITRTKTAATTTATMTTTKE
jgi:hypothetical protein